MKRLNIRFLFSLSFAILIAACSGGGTGGGAATTVTDGDYQVTDYPGMGGLQKAIKKDASNQLLEEGDLLNGKKVGTWVSYHIRNGLIENITSYNNDGVLHGLFAKIDDRGDLKEKAFYVNGLLEGTRYVYYFTRIKEESEFKNGKLDGSRKVYYDSGEIQEEGFFKDGKRHGVTKWYNEEGEVTIEYEYKNGEKISG